MKIERIALRSLAFALTLSAFACGEIDNALNQVLTNSSVSARRVALSIPEFGVSPRLYSEGAFTNLVAIVDSKIQDCDAQYISTLTNNVRRAIFVAALTRCGAETYRTSIVRWFGNSIDISIHDTDVLEGFIFPAGTELENYIDMHYDAPGISNVLINVKNIYQATSNAVVVTAIEKSLSGDTRRSLLEEYNAGILESIKDGGQH